MIAAIKAHANQFTVLAFLFILGFLSLVLFRYSTFAQQIIIWIICAGYLGWGIGHHMIKHDLSGLIVLEYFLVSGLAGLLLSSVLAAR